MHLLLFFLGSAVFLWLAYRLVGRALARAFGLTPTNNTPAHNLRDGVDYEPAVTSYLLPQHFSAIAAAGPIVGPILAAQYFGWGPAWLWILLGCVFIGGIHDFVALIASVRHQGKSIGEVIRAHMNPRAHLLFLIFVLFALVYVIIAFADITAGTFVQQAATAEGAAPGPAVASSSFLYLGLALIMGVVVRVGRCSTNKATAIFLPLVIVAIIAGPYLPLDLSAWAQHPQQVWGYILLAYCFVAALAPVWLLLQPRGNLGGYFLYVVMIAAVLGLLVGACTGVNPIQQHFFTGWTAPPSMGALPLFPILFITVACGACSGFHGVVASGTTSKQLDRECDAKPIGYGGMLLEGLLACISLATLMIAARIDLKPDAIYAGGIAHFGREALALLWPVKGSLAADPIYGVLYQFALLCFATFVFDTLDACTRLARYVVMEILGWQTTTHRALATAIVLVLPALVLALPPVHDNGVPQPLWRVFWGIFGSSNQLLAALTLLGVTVWMARKRMAWWFAALPAAFMMVMTLWSLLLMIAPYTHAWQAGTVLPALTHVRFGISCSLVVLAVWLMVETAVTLAGLRRAVTQ
jgi:carbon starvation protein